MVVSTYQRFGKGHPCPVCGGSADARRGAGTRCWGYLTDDQSGAVCVRRESARPAGNSGGWFHRLSAPCECASGHVGARTDSGMEATGANATRAMARSRDYELRDPNGVLVAHHVRVEESDGRKRFYYQRPDRTSGLGGLPQVASAISVGAPRGVGARRCYGG